jgi:hypothetical protein
MDEDSFDEQFLARTTPSELEQFLAERKSQAAKEMTPDERLALALELSDFCYRLCSLPR